jgi:hypothetical protein
MSSRSPFLRDPLAVHHVELRLAERRRDLVLHDLHARAAADDLVAVLDGADAPDVDAHRRVELQRAAAGRGLRVAEHHADLLAQLVDEDQAGLRLRDDAGELAQRLRHQPRLQAHLAVAHLAFDLRARHERGHRVDDDHVDAVGADEHLDDLERLLAVVGLRDQQVLEVDARASARTVRRARARRRRTPPRRRASVPRRSSAAPASSCPTTPARRSR